jgi:hypothetical protein
VTWPVAAASSPCNLSTFSQGQNVQTPPLGARPCRTWPAAAGLTSPGRLACLMWYASDQRRTRTRTQAGAVVCAAWAQECQQHQHRALKQAVNRLHMHVLAWSLMPRTVRVDGYVPTNGYNYKTLIACDMTHRAPPCQAQLHRYGRLWHGP